MTCDTLEQKSTCVEERCETLEEKLNTELYSVKFLNQEEEHLEVENIRKLIDDEFVVDMRLEGFEECDEDEESKKTWKMTRT